MALLVPQLAAWLSTLAGSSVVSGTQTAANGTIRVSQSLGATYLVCRCDMVSVSQRTCATTHVCRISGLRHSLCIAVLPATLMPCRIGDPRALLVQLPGLWVRHCQQSLQIVI